MDILTRLKINKVAKEQGMAYNRYKNCYIITYDQEDCSFPKPLNINVTNNHIPVAVYLTNDLILNSIDFKLDTVIIGNKEILKCLMFYNKEDMRKAINMLCKIIYCTEDEKYLSKIEGIK